MANEQITLKGAANLLSEAILRRTTNIKVGSLWEFTRDVWAKSEFYDRPELFNVWHVGYILERINEALENKLWFCGVLPRGFLKSTLAYSLSIWLFLKYCHTVNSTGFYLSFADHLSTYHVSQINKVVRANAQLMEWMRDRSQADYSFRYSVGNSDVEIYTGGITTFKRGQHTNRFMICLGPETKIRYRKEGEERSGSYVSISEIKVGGMVLTHRSRFKKVTKTFERDVSEEIISLGVEGIKDPIKITKRHKLLTTQGWVTAADLTLDHILLHVQVGGISNSTQSKYVRSFMKHGKRGKYRITKESSERRVFNWKKTIGERNITVGRPRMERRLVACNYCKKKFEVPVSEHRKFCSLSCSSSGEFNRRFNQWSSTLPWGFEFQKKLKSKVRKLCNFRCVKCGISEEEFINEYHKHLDVHHINEDKLDNNLGNLIALCKSCHAKLHSNKLSFQQFLHNGRRIISINVMKYSGKVYNLEVEEDNTYVGEKGIIFHNCDDILTDPDNPTSGLYQLDKIEARFFREAIFIPNPGVPVIVLGTPLLPNDLFTKLKDDERFVYEFLPAFDPKPDIHVLCPELVSEQQLLIEQRTMPHQFATERMLAPLSSASAYLNDEEIRMVENPKLKSLNPNQKHNLVSDFTVAGFDVGKKRHPSHVTIYISKDGILTQVFQMFLDNWPYVKQVEFINNLTINFDIDKGYIDNTDKVLEERGIHSNWYPLTFTAKQKKNMAQIFEKYVYTKQMEMIVDERQRSQITCVDNELKAPETPLGHGDAFFSTALALLAYFETVEKGATDIGDTQEIVTAYTKEKEQWVAPGVSWTNEEDGSEICPVCQEKVGWVPERKLCLICKHRG